MRSVGRKKEVVLILLSSNLLLLLVSPFVSARLHLSAPSFSSFFFRPPLFLLRTSSDSPSFPPFVLLVVVSFPPCGVFRTHTNVFANSRHVISFPWLLTHPFHWAWCVCAWWCHSPRRRSFFILGFTPTSSSLVRTIFYALGLPSLLRQT